MLRRRTFTHIAVVSFVGLLSLLFGCKRTKPESRSIVLFNGKDLQGWNTYLGPSFDTVQNKRDSIPLGLNHDTLNVFSVVQLDGGPVLRISGERFGGISTQKEFRNYHLRMEFKWGKKKWPPKEKSKRDSGLLYHAVGAHGADFGFWMRSQEFQIQEGDCGDYWGVAGGIFDVPAAKNSNGDYRYDPKAERVTFREGGAAGRHCIKDPDAENTSGEWNTIDLYCYGDTAVHVVNGTTCMILYHSRQAENGQEVPLKGGKIQLQSEGAEIFYRNIRMESIAGVPEALLN
jgi:hypothetical protein